MNKIIVIVLAFCFTSVSAMAGTLTLTLTFDKRPPYAGLAYLNDGGNFSNAPIDQTNKAFISNAYIVTPNSKVDFVNSDDIDHNIYANSPTHNVKFDLGLLQPKQSITLSNSDWPTDAVIRIGCKIHPKMKSYIANVASSNSQVIAFDNKTKTYTVTLDNVSVANAPFALWLPGYDPIKVNIKQGETKSLKLMKRGKSKGTGSLSYQ
ncbi:hypothetical protein C2869_16840 [Saccharobesus litoralis]|uniref:Methylamine utilization protein n=1 Tax=Saccharobesus litoralis TaxID=2172099 RepID=A0A2S0VUT6_9ALTE|nr:hypothetical protein [Saccharobesus litoralis]AWB67987.1 hypothetical protein C2869_16840 [Saccharobesus litoralis]